MSPKKYWANSDSKGGLVLWIRALYRRSPRGPPYPFICRLEPKGALRAPFCSSWGLRPQTPFQLQLFVAQRLPFRSSSSCWDCARLIDTQLYGLNSITFSLRHPITISRLFASSMGWVCLNLEDTLTANPFLSQPRARSTLAADVWSCYSKVFQEAGTLYSKYWIAVVVVVVVVVVAVVVAIVV